MKTGKKIVPDIDLNKNVDTKFGGHDTFLE